MISKIFVLTFFALLSGAACQTPNVSQSVNQTPNLAGDNSVNLAANNADGARIESGKDSAQTITFDASGGARIVGTFYAASEKNSPAVLMLHQFGGTRAAYKDLAGQFQANGINVLTIDGRGFGESTKRADGSTISVSQSNEAVAGMKSDVAAAVKFLSELKNVDKTRIGIVGASYGSSLAIIYAGENSEIKTVALLSPGTNYFGNLPTEPAMEKYGERPILIVAAEDDAESATASRKLDKLAASDRHQLEIYPRGGHGTRILTAGVGLDKTLLEFFRRNL